MSRRVLLLICMSFVRLAGLGVVDDTLDILQYVQVVTSDHTEDTSSNQLNFIGEKLQQKRNERDKKRILLGTSSSQFDCSLTYQDDSSVLLEEIISTKPLAEDDVGKLSRHLRLENKVFFFLKFIKS